MCVCVKCAPSSVTATSLWGWLAVHHHLQTSVAIIMGGAHMSMCATRQPSPSPVGTCIMRLWWSDKLRAITKASTTTAAKTRSGQQVRVIKRSSGARPLGRCREAIAWA